MDAQKIKLMGSAAPAVGTLTKLFVQHHYHSKQVEQRAEMEKEIIDKRARARQQIERQRGDGDGLELASPEPLDAEPLSEEELGDFDYDGCESFNPLVRSDPDFREDFQTVHSGPNCDYCSELLDMLEDESCMRQRQGVEELAQLKRLMQQNPTREEMHSMMDGFDVLPELTLEM